MPRSRVLTTGRVRPNAAHPAMRDCRLLLRHDAVAQGLAVNGQQFYPYTGGVRVDTPSGSAARATSSSNPIYQVPSGILGQINSYTLLAFGTASTSGIYSPLDHDNSSTRRFQFRLNNGKAEILPFDGNNSLITDLVAPVALTAAEAARGFLMMAAVEPKRVALLQNDTYVESLNNSTPGQLTSNIYIGARASGVQGWTTGGLNFVGLWPRAMSRDEMLGIAADVMALWEYLDDDDDIASAVAQPDTSLSGAAQAVASAYGALTSAIIFQGAAVASSTAAGVLSTAIPLVGAAASSSSATGMLSTAFPLTGAASATSTGVGTLSTAIRLAGAAGSSSNAAGVLSTSIPLSGAAAGTASGAGTLSTSIALSGAAYAQSSASGNLGAGALLTGAATSSGTAAGNLTTAIPLAGTAQSASSASASLAGSAIALSGAAASQSSAAGVLSTAIVLSGVARAASAGAGHLSTAISLAGRAYSASAATGALSIPIRLTGMAISTSSATGVLTDARRGPLPVNPQFIYSGAARVRDYVGAPRQRGIW